MAQSNAVLDNINVKNLDSQKVERKKSRLRVKGIKVRDKEKIKEAIMISIQKGNYTTREIGLDVGKDYSTISRYLSEMEGDAKWGVKRDADGNSTYGIYGTDDRHQWGYWSNCRANHRAWYSRSGSGQGHKNIKVRGGNRQITHSDFLL